MNGFRGVNPKCSLFMKVIDNAIIYTINIGVSDGKFGSDLFDIPNTEKPCDALLSSGDISVT